MWIENGGYATFAEMEIQRMRIQNLKDCWMIVGTWFAGLGAVGVVIVEILKHFCWTACP